MVLRPRKYQRAGVAIHDEALLRVRNGEGVSAEDVDDRICRLLLSVIAGRLTALGHGRPEHSTRSLRPRHVEGPTQAVEGEPEFLIGRRRDGARHRHPSVQGYEHPVVGGICEQPTSRRSRER